MSKFNAEFPLQMANILIENSVNRQQYIDDYRSSQIWIEFVMSGKSTLKFEKTDKVLTVTRKSAKPQKQKKNNIVYTMIFYVFILKAFWFPPTWIIYES